MIGRKEIEHLSKLAKVEINDPEKHIEKVEKLLNYFDRLDKVEFNSEKTLRKEVEMDELREDKYVPYDSKGNKLIEKLKKDQNNYIRAPKMI